VTADEAVWEAIRSAPGLPFDPETRRLVAQDQRQPSRRWIYPWLRPLARLAVTLIVVARRILPIRLTAHSTMDALCVWFLRRCVSPTAATLLIRHFVVETNLLAFVARNAGLAGVPEVTLRPVTLRHLGDRAVIKHDVNVYEVLVALGAAARGRPLAPPVAGLDTAMLSVPPIDPEPRARRLLRLDIQTALCLMNIPFALCLTADEYRRAVHSLRLDTFLLGVLADLTGDPTFRTFAPADPPLRVDTRLDVARAVYEHAVVCEYAHALLIDHARRQRGRPGADEVAETGRGEEHDEAVDRGRYGDLGAVQQRRRDDDGQRSIVDADLHRRRHRLGPAHLGQPGREVADREADQVEQQGGKPG
jgi:hypothetical protein